MTSSRLPTAFRASVSLKRTMFGRRKRVVTYDAYYADGHIETDVNADREHSMVGACQQTHGRLGSTPRRRAPKLVRVCGSSMPLVGHSTCSPGRCLANV